MYYLHVGEKFHIKKNMLKKSLFSQKQENKTSKQSDFIMKEYATSLEYEQSYLHKKTGGKK